MPAAAPGPAKSKTVVRVTAADHPGFGRVVLDAPNLAYSVTRDGQTLLVRFAEDPAVATPPRMPQNVLGYRLVPGGMELTLPPDSTVHDRRIGTKVVIDIDDSVASKKPPPPAQPQEPPKPAVSAATTAVPGPTVAEAQNSDVAPRRSTEPSAAGMPAPARPGTRAAVPIAANRIQETGRGTGLPAVNPPAPSRPAAEIAVPATPGHPSVLPVPGTPPATGPAAPPPRAQAKDTQDAHITDASQLPRTPPGRSGEDPDQPNEQNSTKSDGPAPVQADPGPLWPVTRDPAPSGPVAIAAFKAHPPGDLSGTAIQVPFPVQVGAALFSRGAETIVVFDERRPIDLSALHDDPVFGQAVTSIFPAATMIRLTRPPGQSVILSPAASGWRISVVAASPRPTALTPVVTADGITFAADAPGQVVAITDPRTGGTLIVGTQRTSGQGVAVERRTPEFILPVTGQGVVVSPLSAAISLRITQAGFVLSGGQTGLAISQPQRMEATVLEAAGLTRLFEFPRQTTENLAWRAKQQAIDAAVAPPLARGPLRFALAETLLALGLGVEAQTVLRVAMKDDPREAASPATTGLVAIAALLAGRPREASDLADPRLAGTDEIALWRAIQTAMADEGSPKAASVLATTAPLLFTYPAELRRRVLPLAMETMVLGGEADAAAPLLAERDNDPRLAYARALLLQARNDDEGALAAFDAIANTRSPFDHARAAIHAIELRLTMGKLDDKGAADALERLLYAWRGDERDLALRLRIAELRRKTGEWRSVFTQLRAAKADFPAHVAEIDRRLKEAFAAVPKDPSLDKMPPTDLIALLEENAELMATGPDGEPMRALLAEKLMALDLPKRADPLLTRLMRAAPYGPARAGFGATLATLRLREGDGDGALLALSESNSADMGDAVRDRRALITARVEAKRGHIASAVEALAGDQSPEALDTRATILEQAKDWPAARDALAALAASVVPDSGTLTDAQLRVMLRLVSAATFAGDEATLGSLREKLRTRLGGGPQADLFRLLTTAPVRGTADLGRARAEIGLARAVTADMGPRDMSQKKPAAKTP